MKSSSFLKALMAKAVAPAFVGAALLASSSFVVAEPQGAKGSQQTSQSSRQSTGFFYGGGLNYGQSVYANAKDNPLAIPLVGYLGERLQVFGPFVRYDVAQQGPITLFTQLAPRFQGFDDGDGAIFEGMATRKKTVEAGIGVRVMLDQWQLQGSTMSELFGTSNGTEIKATLGRRFQKGPFFMTPDISASYLSNDHVDYYYGVRANEANSQRPAYRGVKTINPSINFTLATPIFFGGMTRLTLSNTWLGSEIKNSPLVDRSSYFGLRLIFSRFF